jgi:hypothetical protein
MMSSDTPNSSGLRTLLAFHRAMTAFLLLTMLLVLDAAYPIFLRTVEIYV